MTELGDPYRQASGTCLQCKLPLRPFGARLVCDDCGAMLIELSDLESAITDLDSEHMTLAFAEREAVPERCPRCEQAMQAAALHRGREQLLPRVVHCAKHGAWLPGGVLVSLFAVIGHRAPPRMSANSTQTGGLRIGAWQSKARQRERAVLVDPHAGSALACPGCGGVLGFAGDRHTCTRCGSALVADAALAEIVGELTGAPYEVPAIDGAASAQTCPVCHDALTAQELATARVLRCAVHGVWFPPGSLEAALAALAGAPPKLGGFWSRLFGKS